MNLDGLKLERFIRMALEEDIGFGDITTAATVDPDKTACGSFIAKSDGVFCGTDVIECIFGRIFTDTKTCFYHKDGDKVKKGTVICRVEGNARSLLTGERIALNIVQHLSGIASYTAETVEKVAGTKAAITDTRKTAPGMRFLEKYAVRIGGGSNHRYNLSNGMLIKDNHIAAAGGIVKAISLAKKNASHLLKIEVEVETIEDMLIAIDAGADVVMLDNMGYDDIERAVKLADGRVKIEASGNMDEKDIGKIAHLGVDIISVGALTHSVRALDISLKLDMN